MFKIRKDKLVMIIVGTVLATLVAAVGGFYVYSNVADITFVKKSAYESMEDTYNKYAKLDKIQTLIEDKSLWNLDEDKAMDNVYDGLVDSLKDKYSEYLDADEVKLWNSAMDGKFSGIGVKFTPSGKDKYEVLQVINDSPAAAAGMKDGDIITAIDGKVYTDFEKAAKAIRGDDGTRVKLTFTRNGKTKEISIVRGEVKEQTVYSAVTKDKYGYIIISAFETGTADEFKTELSNMETQGVKGLIIDLRNNGGGYTNEGVKIADMLLPSCTVTYTEDKNGNKEYYNSDENCTKLKYVVLVNENTASTSEILAAAIKDNKKNSLIGQTTYGKGIIQGSYNLGDGTALKLTILQYFSPKGDKIHKVGVKPDYVVKMTSKSKTDVQFTKAIKVLKSK